MSLFLYALSALVPAPLQSDGFVECTRVVHTFVGESAGDLFGWVSAPLPDLDGDGAPELVVGAPGESSSGTASGRVYVYSGRSGAELFRASGVAASERLGAAVRCAGDVDGDGIEDVIAGGTGGTTTTGVARVLSGASGAEIHALQHGGVGAAFGYSVAGVGDVDGDGVPDLAVGAPGAPMTGTGTVVVISGADGTSVLCTFLGETAGDNFGSALGALSDVTGDGVMELIVGAANWGLGSRGRAYVLDLGLGTVLHVLSPDAGAREFGQFFCADVGLIDGDAFHDVYVGDFADGSTGRGKAYVFSGATGARVLTLTGSGGAGFGIGRGIDDVDGDGRVDLVMGSWTASSGASRAGRLQVFSGATGALLRTITSTIANEALGFDAHGLGDVDADGFPEVVGTAASFDNSRGRVVVIGRAPLEPFGSAVAGSGGIEPTLAPAGCPRLGMPFTLQVAGALGGAPGVLIGGTTRVDQPFRGGVLYPDPFFLLHFHVAGGVPGTPGDGSAAFLLPVPSSPSLLGARFFMQALYADPGAPQGFAFTAGLGVMLY
jgi:hypothetical protein